MASSFEDYNMGLDEFMDKYYRGTYNFTLDEFPMIYEAINPGQYSNIATMYSTYGDPDNPSSYVLYPTMYQGKQLSEADIDRNITEGRHFGVYENVHEMMTVDQAIHAKFDEQSITPMVSGESTEDKNNPRVDRKFSVRRNNPTNEPIVPDPLEPGEWEEKKIFDKMFNTEIFDHPVAREKGITNYRTLDKSDLTAEQKFDLILHGSRHGELI